MGRNKAGKGVCNAGESIMLEYVAVMCGCACVTGFIMIVVRSVCRVSMFRFGMVRIRVSVGCCTEHLGSSADAGVSCVVMSDRTGHLGSSADAGESCVVLLGRMHRWSVVCYRPGAVVDQG